MKISIFSSGQGSASKTPLSHHLNIPPNVAAQLTPQQREKLKAEGFNLQTSAAAHISGATSYQQAPSTSQFPGFGNTVSAVSTQISGLSTNSLSNSHAAGAGQHPTYAGQIPGLGNDFSTHHDTQGILRFCTV